MKYDIIYSDPPWAFTNKKTGGSMVSGSAAHYSVISLQDICALPIPAICSDNCALFMWWVGSQPKEALAVMEAWGFELKTMTGFTWVKWTKSVKPWFGMGFYTRAGSENCLIAIKGRPKIQSHGVRSVIHAPVESHSKKPGIVRERIVQLIGDVPRVELFARENVPGWAAFGLEVENSIILT